MMQRKFDKTMEEVKQAMDENANICLVDVRELDEYKEGHLPKARLCPLSEIHEKGKDLPYDQDLYVYCRSGQRSGKAVTYLKQMGYENVFNIGGIIYWPYEIEKGE